MPIGTLDGPDKSTIITTNGQIDKPADYAALVVKVKNGDVVRIGDIAQCHTGTSNRLASGYYNNDNAVILSFSRPRMRTSSRPWISSTRLLPELHRLLPADVKLEVLNDRTKTIKPVSGTFRKRFSQASCL